MAEAVRTLAGVTGNTFKHLQLGAGAMLTDFDYTSVQTPAEFKTALMAALRAGQSLGGTQGGINVNVVPEMRKTEIDGANVPFKGDSVIDSWTCQMSATLKEFTPAIMQAAFPTAEFADVGTPGTNGESITAMRIRTGIGPDDYYGNVCWVATTQYGYVMVAMFNALGSITGDIVAADKGEGGIPIQVTGNIEDFDDIDYAPCEVWFVDVYGGIIDRTNVRA